MSKEKQKRWEMTKEEILAFISSFNPKAWEISITMKTQKGNTAEYTNKSDRNGK